MNDPQESASPDAGPDAAAGPLPAAPAGQPSPGSPPAASADGSSPAPGTDEPDSPRQSSGDLASILKGKASEDALQTLRERGYYDLSQFGDSPGEYDSAARAIDQALVKEKVVAWPGVAATLKSAWRRAHPIPAAAEPSSSLSKKLASLPGAARAFDEAGYTELGQLGGSEAEFNTAVDAVLTKINKLAYKPVVHQMWLETEAPKGRPDSPLTKALTGAAPSMGDAALAFTRSGYQTVQSLGKTETEFTTNVAPILKGIGRLGYLQRIQEMWQSSQRQTPTSAKLPQGKPLDLTQSAITLTDNTKFEFPSALRVGASEDWSAARKNLDAAAWMVLARNLWMMHGLDMTRALAGADDAKAPKAALMWQVTNNLDWLDTAGFGRVESRTTTSQAKHNLAKSLVFDVKADVDAPYVSVAAGYGHDEKTKTSDGHSTLFVTAMYRFVYATIHLDRCTVVSQALVDDLIAAAGLDKRAVELKGVDHSRAAMVERLSRVFAEYGHAVPRVLHIGAALFFQDEKELSGSLSTSEVKDRAEAAVAAKIGPASGGISASGAKGTATEDETQSGNETQSFHTLGGDLAMTSDPSKWAPTTGNPNSWVIVGREGMRPLLDLISSKVHPTMVPRVKRIWDEHVTALWNGYPAPAGYYSPLLDGRPFTIQLAGTKTTRRDNGGILISGGPRAKDGGYAPGARWLDLATVHENTASALGFQWRAAYAGAVDPVTGLPLYHLVGLGSAPFCLAYDIEPQGTPQLVRLHAYQPSRGLAELTTRRDVWVLIPADSEPTEVDSLSRPPRPRRFAIRHFSWEGAVMSDKMDNRADAGAEMKVLPHWPSDAIPEDADLWELAPVGPPVPAPNVEVQPAKKQGPKPGAPDGAPIDPLEAPQPAAKPGSFAGE